VCVELPAFSFQLSRIYSLWHGCHGPHPDTLSPVSRGRGEDCVFGGQSVAGSLVHAKPRSRERETHGGRLRCVLNCLLSPLKLSRIYSLWHGCHGPRTPDPSRPFHGGEGRIACSVVSQWQAVWFTRSREAAKGRRERRFSVFGGWAGGSRRSVLWRMRGGGVCAVLPWKCDETSVYAQKTSRSSQFFCCGRGIRFALLGRVAVS
jgi:hypothetical protein